MGHKSLAKQKSELVPVQFRQKMTILNVDNPRQDFLFILSDNKWHIL